MDGVDNEGVGADAGGGGRTVQAPRGGTDRHMTSVTNLAADVRAFTSNAFLVTGDRKTLVDAGANFDIVSRIESRVDGLDDHEFSVLHTPGHKNDHVCLYAPTPTVCFAGDLVFADGAFGRTDLEEGNRETLIRSIDRLLDAVDPTLSALHTGHGPSVTTDAYATIERAGQAARRR